MQLSNRATQSHPRGSWKDKFLSVIGQNRKVNASLFLPSGCSFSPTPSTIRLFTAKHQPAHSRSISPPPRDSREAVCQNLVRARVLASQRNRKPWNQPRHVEALASSASTTCHILFFGRLRGHSARSVTYYGNGTSHHNRQTQKNVCKEHSEHGGSKGIEA
jgi:hypothetical protein